MQKSFPIGNLQEDSPVIVSSFSGDTGREAGMNSATSARAGRSRPHWLVVSLRDELADRLIGFGQRGLAGQEDDAEVAGAGLLAEA